MTPPYSAPPPHGLPPFACTHSPGFPELLQRLDCSLVLSTYQAGKLIVLSATEQGLVQLPRTFDKPMGLAADAGRMAVATRHEVVVLVNAPMLAPGYPPRPGTYDALFVPTAVYCAGELDLHDLAWAGETLWAVNTRFSCLCRIGPHYSFVPAWTPPFVTAFTAEDRCHLNGMALADGAPAYVTALGATDAPEGWRAGKTRGGVLLHVPSGEIVLSGLPMPHSPRLVDGRLYVLLSASGTLVEVDPERGTYEPLVRVPGFVRGLAAHGDHLFVGLSKLRPGRTLGDLPMEEGPRGEGPRGEGPRGEGPRGEGPRGEGPRGEGDLQSGVVVVHRPTGRVEGELRYLNSCEEVYDVQVLPGLRRPGLLGPASDIARRALFTPQHGFWGSPSTGS